MEISYSMKKKKKKNQESIDANTEMTETRFIWQRLKQSS